MGNHREQGPQTITQSGRLGIKHFYNSGKGWVISSALLGAVGLGLGVTSPAAADQVPVTANQQNQPVTNETTATTSSAAVLQASASETTSPQATPDTGSAVPQVATLAVADPAGSATANQVANRSSATVTQPTAAAIATPIPVPTTINDWMPDTKLQQLTLANLNTAGNLVSHQSHQLTTVAQITPGMMLDLKAFNTATGANGQPDATAYTLSQQIQSLKGLEFAVNLTAIDLSRKPEELATNGALSDLSALAGLSKLTTVALQGQKIRDLSALGNHPALTNLNLANNQIVDLRPLATDPLLTNGTMVLNDQTESLPTITLNPTSFKNGGLDLARLVYSVIGSHVPVTPLTAADVNQPEWSAYAAVAATVPGVNDANEDVFWAPISPDASGGTLGYLTLKFTDSSLGNGQTFTGVIVQKINFDTSQQWAGPETISYVDDGKQPIADTLVIQGKVGDTFTTNLIQIPGYQLMSEPYPISGTLSQYSGGGVYVYTAVPESSVSAPVTAYYLDAATGQAIAPGERLTGALGATYQVTAPVIPGYTFKELVGAGSGPFTSAPQMVLGLYTKAATVPPVKPTPPTPPVTPEQPSRPTPAQPGVVQKGQAVYAVKKIYLYKNKTFKPSQRVTVYAKKARIDRPMFVVTGTSRSSAGRLRYRVTDVNHQSKTDGMTGYITANAQYVLPVYYQTKHTKVTVIAAAGVNSYRQRNLTKQVAHFRQGTVLTVKRIVTHHLTTRFVLQDGTYITANKKLVFAGTHRLPTRVVAKTAIRRYATVQLAQPLKWYAAGHGFKVHGVAFSNPQDVAKGSTLRYRVAGGYITGNRQFVRSK